MNEPSLRKETEDSNPSGLEGATRFILVRHGQTEWNRAERFRGHADVALNETGVLQARATAMRISAEFRPTAVFSSPLIRAMDTARAIGTATGAPVEPRQELKDLDYGRWQGLTTKQVGQEWPVAYHAWCSHPDTARIPGGESLEVLRSRGCRLVEELARSHRNQTVVLVGHDAINRAILLVVLGMGNDNFWRLGQHTCAVNVFDWADAHSLLLLMNDTCHLRSL